MKKIVCFILSCVLCLGLCATAYAAPDETWASLPAQSLRASSNGVRYVKAIQRYMMNYDSMTFGYIYDSSLSGHGIDGSFGPNTELAVRRFQYLNGVNQTGVVATNTWKAMRDNLMYLSTAYGFKFYRGSIQANGEDTTITFRQGTTTGNWGSRPYGVTGMTDSTSWNVFNY